MAFAWHLHGICMAFAAGHQATLVGNPHVDRGRHESVLDRCRPGTAWDPGTWDGPWKMPTASQDGNLATSKRCGTTKRALEGGAWVMIGMVWNGMEWYGISDLNALDICCSCSH
jgi:hypothetical protein